MTSELLRRSRAPLRAESFLSRDKIAAIVDVQPIGVGPMFMYAAPRIGPVVVDLTPQQMAANAPHMFILAQAVQVLVADEYIVDVLNLEGEMVEAGSLIPHAEECVMIHIIITSIDPAEL